MLPTKNDFVLAGDISNHRHRNSIVRLTDRARNYLKCVEGP